MATNHYGREIVEATPRRAMTVARKRRIWTREHGKCRCDAAVPVNGPGVTYDHASMIWMGTPDEDAGVFPLCDMCNNAKTYERDLPAIAKTKRLIKKNSGERKPSRLRSRPFQKVSRPFPKRKDAWR